MTVRQVVVSILKEIREAKHGVELLAATHEMSGNWDAECLTTRLPLPTVIMRDTT